MVDRAATLHFVGDQSVLLIEEENAEMLAVFEALRKAEVIENAAPGRQRRARFDLASGQAFGRRLDQFQFLHSAVADAFDLLQTFRRGRDDLRERSEAGQQAFRDRLRVDARKCAKQDHLEEFVVGHRVGAAVRKALTQAPAMSGLIVGGGFCLGRAAK